MGITAVRLILSNLLIFGSVRAFTSLVKLVDKNHQRYYMVNIFSRSFKTEGIYIVNIYIQTQLCQNLLVRWKLKMSHLFNVLLKKVLFTICIFPYRTIAKNGQILLSCTRCLGLKKTCYPEWIYWNTHTILQYLDKLKKGIQYQKYPAIYICCMYLHFRENAKSKSYTRVVTCTCNLI